MEIYNLSLVSSLPLLLAHHPEYYHPILLRNREISLKAEVGLKNVQNISILTTIVMTPSFPTFSIARPINSPISRSPLAEIVATCFKVLGNYKTNDMYWNETPAFIPIKLSTRTI